MSVVHMLPEMPDLGPVMVKPHPTIPGDDMVNVAGIVQIARACASVKSLAFYQTFCKSWDRVKDTPRTSGDKQKIALKQALQEIGHNVDFLDMDKVGNDHGRPA